MVAHRRLKQYLKEKKKKRIAINFTLDEITDYRLRKHAYSITSKLSDYLRILVIGELQKHEAIDKDSAKMYIRKMKSCDDKPT